MSTGPRSTHSDLCKDGHWNTFSMHSSMRWKRSLQSLPAQLPCSRPHTLLLLCHLTHSAPLTPDLRCQASSCLGMLMPYALPAKSNICPRYLNNQPFLFLQVSVRVWPFPWGLPWPPCLKLYPPIPTDIYTHTSPVTLLFFIIYST